MPMFLQICSSSTKASILYRVGLRYRYKTVACIIGSSINLLGRLNEKVEVGKWLMY